MTRYDVTKMTSLLRDVEENISFLGSTIKYFMEMLRNINKAHKTLETITSTLEKNTAESRFNNSARYPIFSTAILEISNQMHESVRQENLRYHHLEKCLYELEIYYNNQLAIFHVRMNEHEKKNKKLMREIFKHGGKKGVKLTIDTSSAEKQLVELLNSYLLEILTIEHSLYYRIFDCFKNFNFDQILSFRQAVENHVAEYNKMLALQEESEITKHFYMPMLSNPEKYVFRNLHSKSKKNIIIYDDSHGIPEDEDGNISYITWTGFKAVKEGCIDLDPGDEIICHSQAVNGWRYGLNKTTDKHGWFPGCFVKSSSELINVIEKFKEQLPIKNNN